MANATFLHIGTGQGLVVASKPGTSPEWRITKHTLDGRAVAGLALGADIPVRIVAAVPGVGLFHSANGGREWMLSLPVAVSAILADPDQLDRIYAALDQPEVVHTAAGVAPQSGSLMLSADGGRTWQSLGPLPAARTRVLSLALTGDETWGGERRVWVGLESGGVLSSADGRHWQGVSMGLPGRVPIRALVGTGSQPTDLFAATSAGIYRLTAGRRADDGEWKGTSVVWQLVAGETPHGVAHLLPVGRSAAATGTTSALLAIDRAGVLWQGTDGGSLWQIRALTDAATAVKVTAFAAHPEYPDRAYAGTAAGRVYETRNRGRVWEDAGIDPGGAVLSLGIAVIK